MKTLPIQCSGRARAVVKLLINAVVSMGRRNTQIEPDKASRVWSVVVSHWVDWSLCL